LEEKHALRIQLEGAVESLWKQFQSALKNYNESTEERKLAFENLKSKDEKSAKEIETQMRKLQRLQVSNIYLFICLLFVYSVQVQYFFLTFIQGGLPP